MLAVSRGFPLPRAESEQRSAGAACSTISPPVVPYTVSPVSTVYTAILSVRAAWKPPDRPDRSPSESVKKVAD